MNSEQILKLVQQYFEAYPEEAVFHFTSDGQAFHGKNAGDAFLHERTLVPDGKPFTVSRKEYDAYIKDGSTGFLHDEPNQDEHADAWVQSNGLIDGANEVSDEEKSSEGAEEEQSSETAGAGEAEKEEGEDKSDEAPADKKKKSTKKR
jgi:hypothetical protein